LQTGSLHKVRHLHVMSESLNISSLRRVALSTERTHAQRALERHVYAAIEQRRIVFQSEEAHQGTAQRSNRVGVLGVCSRAQCVFSGITQHLIYNLSDKVGCQVECGRLDCETLRGRQRAPERPLRPWICYASQSLDSQTLLWIFFWSARF